jgi:hypothetical protein
MNDSTRSDLHRGADDATADVTQVHPLATAVGPWTAYTVSASSLALAAFTLGADWLGTPWLGLPVGVWAIAAGYGVLGLHRGAGLGASAWRGASVRTTAASAAGTASGLLRRFRRAGDDTSDIAARPRSESGSGPVVVRVGLDLPAEERERVLDAAARLARHDGVRFDWITLGADAEGDEHAGARRRLFPRRTPACDATLRRVRSASDARPSLEIVTHRHGAGTGLRDWGRPEDFTYAGVFPTRLDPARVSLGNTRVDAEVAPVLARLVAAAAALRRTAAHNSASGPGLGASPAERAADDFLLDALRWSTSPDAAGPARRVAARVGSAWLVSRGLSVSPTERVQLAGAAAGILSREPQLVLQSLATLVAGVAAGSSGAGTSATAPDASGAENALVDAVERLLHAGERVGVDPVPFVMSELELGTGDALTAGRIAAGFAMIWSGAPECSLRFLRDDLLADIKHAPWLRQRPQVRDLLARLVRSADRARNTWDSADARRAA